MNGSSLLGRIKLGYGIATFIAVVLGGLGCYAAAHQATGWAIAAVALAAALMGALGAWASATVDRDVRGLAREVERVGAAGAAGQLRTDGEAGALPLELRAVVESMNGALEPLVRASEAATERLVQLGRGELPAPVAGRQAGDGMTAALNACIAAVSALVEDTAMLSGAALKPVFDGRVAEGRHAGRFQQAVKGAQEAFEKLHGRAFWYEQILDAIPFPLSVTDQDMRWTFINAPVEKFLNVKRKDVLGKACESWNADICRTESCGVARLRQGQLITHFKQQGMNFRVDTAYLKDPRGEIVGHVEVVQDVTPLVRVSEYQRDELGRLSQGLVRLAAGDLSTETKIGEADAHTQEARREFLAAAATLEQLRGAVSALVRDTTRLVDAAVAGRLAERADPKPHQGEFRKVVEGVNRTLDAVMAPINDAAAVLEELARKDLRARVSGAYSGDHARITAAVNAAGEELQAALARVADSVEQVSSASTQIAASSQAVASGASEQAASLEQTSASIEEVASMTKQSADHAQHANLLAETARGAANEGTAAVGQMQGAMSRIKASAEGTSQIIRDINDIAFQTNLLALNAAVEAARAGEAGRGFAVVAEEVRSLALRAKEAASKTEELIRQSVKEAGEGETTAKQVAGKLAEIAAGISKVTDIISEIAAGAREQNSGIEQVTRAVAEMDKVTQQNAASAEESSSAASELSGQAEELAALVGSFRLERDGGSRPALTRGASPRTPAVTRMSPPARPHPVLPRPAARAAREDAFPMDDASDVKDF